MCLSNIDYNNKSYNCTERMTCEFEYPTFSDPHSSHPYQTCPQEETMGPAFVYGVCYDVIFMLNNYSDVLWQNKSDRCMSVKLQISQVGILQYVADMPFDISMLIKYLANQLTDLCTDVQDVGINS